MVNGRVALVLRGGQWEEVFWDQVEVGDMVKILVDTFVPADVVLISSSSDDGECFIETADLDG